MRLDSYGILIDLRPFGERDAVAHIFTYDYGVMVGVIKAAQIAKKNKPLIGQVGAVSWNARLDSQLGAFHWEAEKNLAADFFIVRDALNFMNSAFQLINVFLPEREKYPSLYDATLNMLSNLANAADKEKEYMLWEVLLLQELGYGLNLSCCSGCGKRSDLEYLSPKTGRAVCRECAQPYLNRLYKLPLTLSVTEKFLEKACDSQGVVLPMARRFLMRNRM